MSGVAQAKKLFRNLTDTDSPLELVRKISSENDDRFLADFPEHLSKFSRQIISFSWCSTCSFAEMFKSSRAEQLAISKRAFQFISYHIGPSTMRFLHVALKLRGKLEENDYWALCLF